MDPHFPTIQPPSFLPKMVVGCFKGVERGTDAPGLLSSTEELSNKSLVYLLESCNRAREFVPVAAIDVVTGSTETMECAKDGLEESRSWEGVVLSVGTFGPRLEKILSAEDARWRRVVPG